MNENGSTKHKTEKTLLDLSLVLICCSLPILMGSTVYNSLILPEDEQREDKIWIITVKETTVAYDWIDRSKIAEKSNEKRNDWSWVNKRWKIIDSTKWRWGAEKQDIREKIWNKIEMESSRQIIHKWFPKDSIVQEMANYAYKIGWENLLYLVSCENWWWDIDLQSKVMANWNREESYWLCQISKNYYSDIVNDKRFFTDWKRQLDECWKLRKQWTLFYWPERIINWVPCYVYMEKFIEYK